ncbi:MAG: hypothetical protein WCY93_11035 [Anaerolineaceae bacterium]
MLREYIKESFLRHLAEGRNPNYKIFPIFGEYVTGKTIKTPPILTKLKLKNAFKKLGGRDSAARDSIILNSEAAKKVEIFLRGQEFRKETNDYAKMKIHLNGLPHIYGTFVKDQVLYKDVYGDEVEGKFVTKWPYPESGNNTRKLKLTVETVVVIAGRNSPFENEDQIWFAYIFAPQTSDLVKDAKSGLYRFSATRDIIT